MPPKHHHKHGPGRGHSPPGSPGRGRGRGRHSPPGSPGRGRGHHHHHHHPPHHHHHHHPSDDEHSERSHSPPPPPPHHDESPSPPPPAVEEAPPAVEKTEEVDVSNLDLNDGGGGEAEEVQQPEMGQEESSNNNNDNKKKKNQIKLSPKYGGDGGSDQYDHGANKHIAKLTVYTNGHVVCGIDLMYQNFDGKGPRRAIAGKKDGDATTFNLATNEFITWAKVRSNKFVQELTFRTNKGRLLGPVGGQGWKGGILSKDKAGDEVEVPAPFKKQLCGIAGSSGNWIESIAFRWGPVPDKVMNA